MIRVKATREGLPGNTTASGYVIDEHVYFVALPCIGALHRFIRLRNPMNGRVCYAQVLDVGPWCEHDEKYVFGEFRPLAETGTDERGRPTNRAGIDLGEAVWRVLAMDDNGPVEWEFI
jgi:hypothetical protein